MIDTNKLMENMNIAKKEYEKNNKTNNKRVKKNKRSKKRVYPKSSYKLDLDSYPIVLDTLNTRLRDNKISKEDYKREIQALIPYKRYTTLINEDTIISNPKIENKFKNNDFKSNQLVLKLLKVKSWYINQYIKKNHLDDFIGDIFLKYMYSLKWEGLKFLKTDTSGHPLFRGWIKENKNKVALYSYSNKILELESNGDFIILYLATRTNNKKGEEDYLTLSNKNGVEFDSIFSRGCIQHMNQFFSKYKIFNNINKGSGRTKINNLVGYTSTNQLKEIPTSKDYNMLIPISMYNKKNKTWFRILNKDLKMELIG